MQYHYEHPVPCKVIGFMDTAVQGLILGSTLTDRAQSTIYHIVFKFLLDTKDINNSECAVYVLSKGRWYNTYTGKFLEIVA